MIRRFAQSGVLGIAALSLFVLPVQASSRVQPTHKPSPAHNAPPAHKSSPTRRPTWRAHQPPLVPAGWPKVLMIPKLHVHSSVESLSFGNVSETMAPLQWGDVAWYDRGPRPGAVGRSEIWGHLDSTCCAAVFYELKTLRHGDTIQVQYKKGKVLSFTVQWLAEYPNTALPLKFIYGPSTARGLVLFTCAGIFHYDGTGYDHKLIVYAKLNY